MTRMLIPTIRFSTERIQRPAALTNRPDGIISGIGRTLRCMIFVVALIGSGLTAAGCNWLGNLMDGKEDAAQINDGRIDARLDGTRDLGLDKNKMDYADSWLTEGKPREAGPDADANDAFKLDLPDAKISDGKPDKIVIDQQIDQITTPDLLVIPDSGPVCSNWQTFLGATLINTMGQNITNFKTQITNFSNLKGWAVEAKLNLTQDESSSNPTSSSLVVEVADGTKFLRLRILDGKLLIYYNNNFTDLIENTTINTKLVHTYLITGKGIDFFLYVDGKLVFNGSGKLLRTTPEAPTTAGSNHIVYGDYVTTADSESSLDYLKYCE